MADYSEKSVPSLEAKNVILQTFHDLQKWREEQLKRFQNRQLVENKKLLESSLETQKNLERELFEKTKACQENDSNKGISDENSFVSNSTTNSTPAEHILRCFSDVSGNSSIFSKNELNIEERDVPTLNVVKRPFLKKRSGLLRYQPKSSQQYRISKSTSTSEIQEITPGFQVNLKSKKNYHPKPIISQVKHADLPESNISKPEKYCETERFPILTSKRNHVNFKISDSDANINNESSSKYADKISSETPIEHDANLNQEYEKQELDEFEILESCAQNSSFNSDSSVVQRVLRGEPILINNPLQNKEGKLSPSSSHIKRIFQVKPLLKKNSNDCDSSLPEISKLKQEIWKKQQPIEDIIHDNELRINNLQKETALEIFLASENDSNERCSTPVCQINHQKNVHSSITGEDDSIINHMTSPIKCDLQMNKVDSNIVNQGEQIHDKMKNYVPLIDKMVSITSAENSEDVLQSSIEEKSILQAKIEELENEIENNRVLNVRLSEICKEREEILRKLKKEYDSIEKYKEDEKNKLKTEMENERRQLKREKETFNRYQKLLKNNPTRKEREELNAARQEVEKLQEELKRQRIKFNNDTKRMKNQLIAAEKERDTFKLENITLTEQCQDLLNALKARNVKIKKDLLVLKKKSEVVENEKSAPNIFTNITTDIQNSSDEISEKNSVAPNNPTDNECGKLNSSLKPRVRFNLVPQYEKQEIQQNLENLSSKELKINLFSASTKDENDDSGVESLNVFEFNEQAPKEIKHGDKIEKIYPSGNREIIFPNGTRKIINIDEKTIKIIFYNGDIKEIYSDKRVVYKYNSGETETRYPCGLQVTEFPNGQVLRQFSDGLREVKFPDGSIQYIHNDGSEEIIAKDGTKVTIGIDGTEIIECKNGEKEIRTKTFKRREFLDGSVRILYESGRKETRYSSGRIKIKDKNGKVVVDTKYLKG